MSTTMNSYYRYIQYDTVRLSKAINIYNINSYYTVRLSTTINSYYRYIQY